jgi:hypothetical protein
MLTTTPTYDYRHLVTLEETNLVGNVYFTHYLRWQGHCRELFLAQHAPGVLRALADDLALVTVSCRCDFFTELFALDTASTCPSSTTGSPRCPSWSPGGPRLSPACAGSRVAWSPSRSQRS